MGNYTTIDLSYLDELALGSNDFKIEMIESFMKNTPEAVSKMKSAIQSADWNTVGSTAHKLKTSFSFVGMENMVQLSRTLQDLGLASERIDEIPGMVSELEQAYKQAEVELNKELNELKNV